MNMAVILIVQLIAKMDIPLEAKEKLTACVFYGQQAVEKPDLYKRLEKCRRGNGQGK